MKRFLIGEFIGKVNSHDLFSIGYHEGVELGATCNGDVYEYSFGSVFHRGKCKPKQIPVPTSKNNKFYRWAKHCIDTFENFD